MVVEFDFMPKHETDVDRVSLGKFCHKLMKR